jgi:hypothetical protein
VNSAAPLLPPGSRKNISTRPLGAQVGPSLWKPSVKSRSPEPSGLITPMPNVPVGLARQPAGDQRLRVDDTPVREARHRVGVDDLFDIGGGIDRREQAGAAQIRGDHLADAARKLAVGRAAAEKVRNRDRHRLDVAFGDLQPEHRAGGLHHAGRGDAGRPGQQSAARQQGHARGNDVGFFDFHADDPRRQTPNSVIQQRSGRPLNQAERQYDAWSCTSVCHFSSDGISWSCGFQLHFTDCFIERLELVQAYRKPGIELAQLPDQYRSRVVIYHPACFGTVLIETRNRAGYDWIEILCHQPEKKTSRRGCGASDQGHPWTKLPSQLAVKTLSLCKTRTAGEVGDAIGDAPAAILH